jgi:two-component system CheB/CheR fusion protein
LALILTAIGGHGVSRFGYRLAKTPQNINLSTMDKAEIMVNDTDESSSDELIVQIKKWRSFGGSQYSETNHLAVTATAQKDSLAACPAKNKNGVIRAKAEDEVMLALEAAGVGIFRWDIRTDRMTWDDALDRLFGLEQQPKALRSKDQFLAHVHPDDRHEILARWERCRSVGEDFETEFRVISLNGKVRWFLSRGKTIIENGAPAYLTGACFDITKRKEMELRREDAHRENDRRKDQFLAHMSHEIRSPMTSILAYTDILLSHLQDADDIECVKIIKQGGNHLLELIGDILDLSKIGSGKLKINREIVSLLTLINEVHSLMEVRAQEKKLPLLLHYEGAIPENIETDRTRLRQILFNLVSNAIKFTAEGKVEIIARVLANERALEVEVSDTGIGISEEQQGSLFQPFVQADSVKIPGQQGTGLGLAITKQLVNMLGGQISFESVLNRGSIFRIKMPIVCPPDITAGTSNGVNCAAGKRKSKILLVDDNQMVCKAMGRLLEISGHEVAVAFDGRSALEKARGFQPDVMVLDLKLPDMGGYALLEQLKKLKPFANTKSIALTGCGEECRRNTGVEFDHFLTKPADATVLETLLLV